MNSHTLSEANNWSSIDSTNKRDGNFTNVSKTEDIRFQDGFDIDYMLSGSTLPKYYNIECNNESHYPLINCTMPP